MKHKKILFGSKSSSEKTFIVIETPAISNPSTNIATNNKSTSSWKISYYLRSKKTVQWKQSNGNSYWSSSLYRKTETTYFTSEKLSTSYESSKSDEDFKTKCYQVNSRQFSELFQSANQNTWKFQIEMKSDLNGAA